jgi:hypothetical protein
MTNSESALGRNRKIMAYEAAQLFGCDPARLFNILADIDQWPAEGEPRVLKRREVDFVQVAFADATRATLKLQKPESGGGTLVELEHDLCLDLEQVNHWRDYWNELFDSLRSRVEI